MKKVLISSIVLFLLLLGACTNKTTLNNALSEVQLTDREKFLLSSTSEQSFVFDFQADQKYKQISVWVDQYAFGKLVGEKINRLTMDIDEKGTLIFTTSQNVAEEKVKFNIGVQSKSASGKNSMTQREKTTNQSIWGSNPSEEIPIDGIIVLASISSSNGHGMSSLSPAFYTDFENHLAEIANYDVVYVLKSEFLE
ncbi:hypothetical protein [Psychrobacillus lasiicapitis]|uniref:Lipoprotein n=1 Tax=Psychrobacillus lasiicapitis TaxID=1636719 RepID=A0A544TI05_9BACI|nr:hypothetical protein [Psychrobacillus lasiicapitis]TQR17082.1 hypothetical protein FG382_02725 [Psychrobacillus lasiicapitis]GGA24714.1 hypothetical protein GCM10011384_12350 [Psychrobacillus lasiicapitis]